MTLVDAAPTGPAARDGRPAWALSPAEVAGQQGVDPDSGLDAGTVATRLERDGPNEVPLHPPAPLWRSVAGQLRDTLVDVAEARRTGL